MASAFIKSGASTWSDLLSVWIKTATSTWTKIFDKPNIPTTITLPYINDYLDTNRINNTTVISNVGDNIYGHRGSWNYSPTSYQYKWQYSNMVDGIYQDFSPTQTSLAHPSPLSTLVSWDDRWVRYAVKATNATGSSDWILSSNAAHLVKYIPSNTSTTISGNTSVGSTLTAISIWETTLFVSGDRTPSLYAYKWTYGDDGAVAFNDNNSSSYTLTSEDLGETLKVTVTAKNTGGEASATSAATAVVGQALIVSGVNFTDSNGRSGRDYNGKLITAAPLTLNFSVSGVSSATSFRVRQRIYNTQTGAYYNPSNTVTTYISTDAAAWQTYSKDYSGAGNMTSISISGSTATLTNNFTINSTFNGSTYSGGQHRWELQYEISVINTGGTRRYWISGSTMGDSQTFDFWGIAPAAQATLTLTPTTAPKNTNITFSGTLASFPTSLNTYPSHYKIDYGDTTDSGWIATDGVTPNPTYSQTKSYTADGTYTVTVTTTPYYAATTSTIAIADVPTRPTSLTTAVSTGSIVLTFAGGTGSQYDIYYSNTDSRPADGTGLTDFPNAVSPYTASTLTARDFIRYFWVRKSTGTVRSAWFPGTTTGSTGGVTARLPLLAPPAPTSPNTTGVTTTNITFNWTGSGTPNSATEDAHTGYEYYTSTSQTNPTASTAATGSVGSTITTKSFSYTASTTPSLQYFWVRAINADAKSAWTAPVSVKPTASVIPTVTIAANSGISQTGGTINWTSTNQSSYSVSGTFSGTGTTGTSVAKTGLTAGTTYTGTITVTSSTGNTATADYSIKTSVAQYTMTWNANGGSSGNQTTGPFDAGTAHTAPSPGTRSGYTVGSYYDTVSLDYLIGPIAVGGTYTPTANTTLNMRWIAVVPNISKITVAGNSTTTPTVSTLPGVTITYVGTNVGSVKYVIYARDTATSAWNQINSGTTSSASISTSNKATSTSALPDQYYVTLEPFYGASGTGTAGTVRSTINSPKNNNAGSVDVTF